MFDSNISNVPATPKFDYPKLMKSINDSTLIVLFFAPRRGIVVVSGGSTHNVGHISEDWNAGAFEDFHGCVTISNHES